MTSHLERLALERRLRVSDRARLVLKILDHARTPLSVQDLHLRACASYPSISTATIRRILSQLTAAGLLRRLYRKTSKPYYERVHLEQRGALIDNVTGQRLQFDSEGIEGLLKHLVHQLGYRLLDYRLELFGIPESASDADLETVVPIQSPPAAAGERASSSSEPPARARISVRSRRGPRH